MKVANQAATPSSSFKGLNWADARDNFQADVLYLSGLGPADTHSSASRVADRIVGQMYSLTGANTIRMPLNEATVASYWETYTGAIDMALTKGNVILCYWAAKGGKPLDLTAFRDMWTAVLGVYGANRGVFFEPINEPFGYNPRALNDFYDDWLAAFPSITRDRVILDGSGYAQRPATVGRDARLEGCWLGYHEYAFLNSSASESAWQRHIQKDVGPYYNRTICTEFGAVMNTGMLGKRLFDRPLDYGAPSSDEFVRYARAITSQFRAWGMGSVYWPGVRDNDIYAICTRSGSGSGATLSLNNESGLALIKYGWGGAPTIGMPSAPARPNLPRRIMARIGLG